MKLPGVSFADSAILLSAEVANDWATSLARFKPASKTNINPQSLFANLKQYEVKNPRWRCGIGVNRPIAARAVSGSHSGRTDDHRDCSWVVRHSGKKTCASMQPALPPPMHSMVSMFTGRVLDLAESDGNQPIQWGLKRSKDRSLRQLLQDVRTPDISRVYRVGVGAAAGCDLLAASQAKNDVRLTVFLAVNQGHRRIKANKGNAIFLQNIDYCW